MFHCLVGWQESWFEVLFARSSRVQKVKGGVSAILKAVLSLFFDPATHDVRSSGVFLDFCGGSTAHIWLSLGIVLADEAALHMMYGCKGSAGLKPCLLCQNVFNHQNGRGISEGDMDGWVQTHACTASSKIELHTPGTIKAIIDRLTADAATSAKSAHAELQTSLGWTLVPNGVMSDNLLRTLCDPTGHVLYDYMHVFFVSGVFNMHCGKLVASLKPLGITPADLNDYVAQWIRNEISR
jgi:hypothetical protein